MAKRKPNEVETTSAVIVDDEDSVREERKSTDKYAGLAEWVTARNASWSEWRDSNYKSKWDEYERLWRGIYSPDERLRASERSQLVTPALSEAVENAAAELEEAVFGRGADYFDLASPDFTPPEPKAQVAAAVEGTYGPEMGAIGPNPGMLDQPEAVDPLEQRKGHAVVLDLVRARLKEDLQKTDFAAETVKAMLYGAVFGSGFGEIIQEDVVEQVPYDEGDMVVAKTQKYTCSKLRALNPRNCAWDPNAESLEKGLGFAITEMVSKHLVMAAQKDGTYRKDADLFEQPPVEEDGLTGDQQEGASDYALFRVKQTKYYGLVPKSLLEGSADPDAVVEAQSEFIDEDDDEFVEAFVVVINDNIVAKAVKNPYSRQDRPVVHFPWDLVPGRLLGRGICEKGASPQKMLDAETRARLDSLALVMAPMMGMDVNRMPRGFKFKVIPGGSVLTNGKPSDVLEQFKFGQLDPNHFQNAASLQAMVQSATGSVDGAALAQGAGDARTGAMSMAMAPIIKRYKRTLIHFLDEFLTPALEKILWRNMQFNKKRYPAVPFKLRAASTMGIMQREYETSQMTSLLASMPPGTPEHRAILVGVVSNTSIPDREKILKLIESAEERAAAETQAMQAMQNDPLAQQLKQVTAQLQIAQAQLALQETQAKIDKIRAETAEIVVNTQLAPAEMASKGSYALGVGQQQAVFDQRMKQADLLLKNRALDEKAADRASNENIVRDQLRANVLTTAMKERNRNDIENRKLSARANAGANPRV